MPFWSIYTYTVVNTGAKTAICAVYCVPGGLQDTGADGEQE